jgi:thiamine transporter
LTKPIEIANNINASGELAEETLEISAVLRGGVRLDPLNLIRVMPAQERWENVSAIADKSPYAINREGGFLMGTAVVDGHSSKTKILAEGALCVALSVVFSYFKLFHMPQGGSVTLEMAPILYFSYKYGCKWGVVTGTLSGILQIICGGYVVNPIQGFLDYPAAFGVLGMAGLFRKDVKGAVAGTAIAMIGRLVCHVLSGVVYFASFAPEGQNVWIYSVVYNASYMIPSVIITSVAAWVIWKKFLKFI